MSDQDKKLNKGELIDIKSLIGDADGGDFSLDDILAEYAAPLQTPEESEPEEQEARFNTIEWAKISKSKSAVTSTPSTS